MQGWGVALGAAGVLAAVAPSAPVHAAPADDWKRVKAEVAAALAKDDLYAPQRALELLRGRTEDEAAKAALSILASHALERGAKDKKGFGVARPAIARRAAIATLRSIAGDAPLEVLLGPGGAESRNWEVRSAVLEALGSVLRARKAAAGDGLAGRAWAALLAGGADDDAILRTSATAGLGATVHPDAGAPLVARLADTAWQARLEAMRGLRALGTEAHVEAIIDALGRERGRLQAEAEGALKALTGGDVGTDPELWRAWWAANRTRARKDRGGAGRAQATAARPRFYGITVDAERVAFVIDVTGSMHRFHEIEPARKWLEQDKDLGRAPYEGDTLMALAKYQLGCVIAELPEASWFNVTLFSTSDIRSLEEQLVRGAPAAKKKAQKFVAGMGWAGDSNLYDGALRALEQPAAPAKAFVEGPDTVCLFTDGWPNAGVLVEDDQILDALAALCAFRRVRIHTVGLAVPKDRRRLLAQLAKQTGGTYVEVPVPIDQVKESQHSHEAGG
jgi:HEAT repeat protein